MRIETFTYHFHNGIAKHGLFVEIHAVMLSGILMAWHIGPEQAVT
jgi:hypothetical protein